MPWRGLAAIVAVAVLIAALAPLRDSLGFSTFYLTFLTTLFFWVAQSTSWNILSGFSGYFSFGQGAFFGVGAYATAVLTSRNDWDFFATMPVAGAVAVVIGLAIGAVAFRLRSMRGEIFALLTLAVPFIIAPLVRSIPALDGGQGVQVPVPRDYVAAAGGFQELVFLVSLAVAAFALAVSFLAQNSRFGWALFAIRDGENVAEGLGVPTFRYKMLAISSTAFIAGLSGSVFALQVGFLTVESVFNLTVPLLVIVMSVLGGRHHWLGPALGALVVVTLNDRLAASGFEGYSLIVLGLILAALVLLAPEGLMAYLRRRPLVPLATFAVLVLALAAYGQWGSPLDWLAVGMAAAAIVAFLPRARRTGRTPPAVAPAVPPAVPPAVAPSIEPVEATLERVQPPPASDAVPSVVVECRTVARSFGGVRALNGVSLSVNAGELVGLVGPNGSGKTTLVNLIAGSFPPTRGEIFVAGVNTNGLAPHEIAHLGVARTYQIPRPFESMSVRDNVAVAIMFGRRPMSLAEARDAATESLELVGLEHLAAARPSGINLHQRQLLEMARALATRPRILLLDEAMAGLNPAEIDNAAAVVRRIHSAGVTIVLVEHILRVVNQLASRIVVLDQGLTLADGDPASVMEDPAVISAYLGRQAHA